METTEKTSEATTDWSSIAHELGREFAERSALSDRENTFVKGNYERLKEKQLFSAAIPGELGGGGLSHAGMCSFLRQMAHYCSSTALALSMHQHLVATNVWKYKKGQGSEELLRKIVTSQLVLVSTGAGDWLASNGTMEKTDGGYLVTAQKHLTEKDKPFFGQVFSAVVELGVNI